MKMKYYNEKSPIWRKKWRKNGKKKSKRSPEFALRLMSLPLPVPLTAAAKVSSESAVQYSDGQLRFWSVCDLSICCVYSYVEMLRQRP